MHRSVRESLAGVGRWPRRLAVTACLLLAVVSALGAAHRSGSASARTPERTVAVVVAARDLPVGRLLDARDLAVERWPPGIEAPGATRRLSARVGARLAGPIRAGEAVTASRLVGTTLTDGLASGVAAVPITVPDPRASELVHPGNRIELLATPRDDIGLDLGAGTAPGAGGPGTSAAPAGSVTVVARRLLVLASLPGPDDESSSLVVAADPSDTLAIARAQSVGIFLAVPVSP